MTHNHPNTYYYPSDWFVGVRNHVKQKYVGLDRDCHDDQNRDRVYNCRDMVHCMDPGQGERCLLKIQFRSNYNNKRKLTWGFRRWVHGP